MVDGVKEYDLIVAEIEHEVAPGMKVRAWGYDGRTPGPTIEAVEGDRIRVLVYNRLSEPTAVHWHGVLLPSGMDGLQGLTQRGIPPGETFAYEFTPRQNGTQMYHAHGDEMTQIGLGAMGHGLPVLLGVSQEGVADTIQRLLPGYMPMGESGMLEHARHIGRIVEPVNTLPMMGGPGTEGPFGMIDMGGMFTVLKVRDHLEPGDDAGWYKHPAGTVAETWGETAAGTGQLMAPHH